MRMSLLITEDSFNCISFSFPLVVSIYTLAQFYQTMCTVDRPGNPSVNRSNNMLFDIHRDRSVIVNYKQAE